MVSVHNSVIYNTVVLTDPVGVPCLSVVNYYNDKDANELDRKRTYEYVAMEIGTKILYGF